MKNAKQIQDKKDLQQFLAECEGYENAKEMLRDYTDRGYGERVISKHLGISRGTVFRWRKEFGIKGVSNTGWDNRDRQPIGGKLQ